jgi:hypothetical protein
LKNEEYLKLLRNIFFLNMLSTSRPKISHGEVLHVFDKAIFCLNFPKQKHLYEGFFKFYHCFTLLSEDDQMRHLGGRELFSQWKEAEAQRNGKKSLPIVKPNPVSSSALGNLLQQKNKLLAWKREARVKPNQCMSGIAQYPNPYIWTRGKFGA